MRMAFPGIPFTLKDKLSLTTVMGRLGCRLRYRSDIAKVALAVILVMPPGIVPLIVRIPVLGLMVRNPASTGSDHVNKSVGSILPLWSRAIS